MENLTNRNFGSGYQLFKGGEVVQSPLKRIPVVLVPSTHEIEIKCPTCTLTEKITLKKALTAKAKANCKKCKTAFFVMPNVRRFTRKETHFKGMMDREKLLDFQSKDAVIAMLVDISLGGIAVTVAKHIPDQLGFKVGETLYVSFTLERKTGDVELHIEGKLKNIVPHKASATHKMGIEFINLDEDTRREIGLFLW